MAASVGQLDRRERLLHSARSLFERWGFDKTSVDDIAREAGISKGAVYLEFPNKDALFKALLHREFARYTEDWLRRFEKGRNEVTLAQIMQQSIAAISANPIMKALMTRDRRFFGSFLRRDTELVGLSVSMRADFFRQLQEAGVVRNDIAAPVIAYLVSALGYGFITADDVIPEQNQVPFEEALHAWGLLLDSALAPARARDRKAARALLVSMVEKMQAALRGLDKPDKEKNQAA